MCEFSDQEISNVYTQYTISKMMLDAYSQLFITHSGFAVENLSFAICPRTSCIIRDIFTGMEKFLIHIIAYTISHLYVLSVSKKVISLMCIINCGWGI